MKRPLETNEATIDPALKDILLGNMRLTWHERLRLTLYMAARHAFKMPINGTHYNTNNPYMVFDSLDDVMARLDLAKVTPHLRGDTILRYPIEAPEIDPSRHFAQWAVVWEPVTNDLRAYKTLKVEIGAGFHLLSLKFTPRHNDHNGRQMQLDEAILYHGHDAYDIDVGSSEPGTENRGDADRTIQLFAAARATIQMIHDDYPLAETVLADGVRDIAAQMRAQYEEFERQDAVTLHTQTPQPSL